MLEDGCNGRLVKCRFWNMSTPPCGFLGPCKRECHLLVMLVLGGHTSLLHLDAVKEGSGEADGERKK